MSWLNILCAFFLLSLLASAEVTRLTNIAGKTITVILVNSDDEAVKFRFPTRSKIVTLPLNQLNEESCKSVALWKVKGGHYSDKLKIDSYSSAKGNSTRDGGSRSYTITPKITIRNSDVDRPSAPGSIRFHLFPYGTNKSIDKSSSMYGKTSFQTVELPSIPPTKSLTIEGDPITYSLTESVSIGIDSFGNSTTRVSKSGHGYKSYALYVLNREGEVVLEKGIREEYLKKYRPSLKPLAKRQPRLSRFEQMRLAAKGIGAAEREQNQWRRARELKRMAILELEDPEAYAEEKSRIAQVAQQKLEARNGMLEKMKETNPVAYERLMKRRELEAQKREEPKQEPKQEVVDDEVVEDEDLFD